MGFNFADYETVADRIDRFWHEHPVGTIITELVHHDDKRFIVRASVWRKARDVVELNNAGLPGPFRDCLQPHATGYAEEIIGSTNVNKTSALENCETSAIGRALANLGYAPKGQRPSREEMVKVASRGETERVIDDARNLTDRDKVCPECNSGVYDNRDENRARLAKKQKARPAFKCKSCDWIAWEANAFDDTAGLIVERGEAVVGDWSIPPPIPRDDYGPDEAPF